MCENPNLQKQCLKSKPGSAAVEDGTVDDASIAADSSTAADFSTEASVCASAESSLLEEDIARRPCAPSSSPSLHSCGVRN